MTRFKTIQEIESLKLDTLSKEDFQELKKDLISSFYYTKSSELTSDGRCLKDVIGNQVDRLNEFKNK